MNLDAMQGIATIKQQECDFMADAKRALRLKVRHKTERGGRRVTTNRPNPSKAPGQDSHPGKAPKDLPSLEFGILSISAIPEDHCILRSILNDSQLRIVKSRTCKEAIARLCRRHMPVVICESDLPDGTWRDVLNQINTLAYRPVLIVTSRLADDHLWAEVLNLGGYNVLAKPFRESEVRHVVASLRMHEGRAVTQTATTIVA